jgi:dihydrofolate synthase/folylpolyglutamate synthase
VDYKQSKQWLDAFINWEVKTSEAAELNLEVIKQTLEKLGNPQDAYPIIHIAGSKGKGSTAAMCAYCLKSAGLKVGLLTSPHLTDVRERIRILTPTDELGWIPEADFSEIITNLSPILEEYKPSYFEILCIIGFEYFRQKHVDIAVIEVGLGGKTDATNVVHPLVSIITAISLEHTHILGNTLAEITEKKAGIIKPNTPVVTCKQSAEIMDVISSVAGQQNADLFLVDSHALQALQTLSINLKGEHQLQNASLTVVALQQIQQQFPSLTDKAIKQGLETVQWPGRFQELQPPTSNQPGVLLDGAHNVSSMQYLLKTLKQQYPNVNYHFLFGVNTGKDVQEMYKLIEPLAASITLTQSSHPKAMPVAELATICGVDNFKEHRPEEVLSNLKNSVNSGELIVATGSLYVVGEVL